MVSDHDRRELHAALEAKLGDRPATTLMELLPPTGYADLVTRDEFRAGVAEIRGEIAELRGRVEGQLGRLLVALIPLMFAFAGLVLAAVKLA